MKRLLMALAVVGLLAGPGLADQSHLLVQQVYDDTAFRFDEKTSRLDSLALGARFLCDEAMALHEAGKYAEAIAKVKEAAKLIGLTLQMK